MKGICSRNLPGWPPPQGRTKPMHFPSTGCKGKLTFIPGISCTTQPMDLEMAPSLAMQGKQRCFSNGSGCPAPGQLSGSAWRPEYRSENHIGNRQPLASAARPSELEIARRAMKTCPPLLQASCPIGQGHFGRSDPTTWTTAK